MRVGDENGRIMGIGDPLRYRGVDILYAPNGKKITFLGAAKERRKLIDEYKIFKMAPECAKKGHGGEEIAHRTQQIKDETRKEWFYECEDWETSDAAMTMNPHRKRGNKGM